MSAAPLLLAQAGFALAAALIAVGAGLALGADNALKRVIGVAILALGGAAVLSALGAGNLLLLALIIAALGQLAVGSVFVVRLQEEYGSVEFPDIDAADTDADDAEAAP